MQSFSMAATSGLIATFLFVLTGCGKPAAPPAGADADHAHAHDHGHEGPHGGHIIELGSEHYHAELTHDEATHRVGVYVLDGAARAAVPIEAESVTISVVVDGESSQYVLPAAPRPGDSEGRSSYFEIQSEALCDIVCGETEAAKTHARLSLHIDGKPYVGVIETDHHHHHHHHDHDHAH